MKLRRLQAAIGLVFLSLSRLAEGSINLSCFGFLWAKLPTLSFSSSSGIGVSEQGYFLSNVPANGTFNVDLCIVGVLGFLAVQVVPILVGSVQREFREDDEDSASAAQSLASYNEKSHLLPGQRYQQPFISSLPIGDSPVSSYVWPEGYDTSFASPGYAHLANTDYNGYDTADASGGHGGGGVTHSGDGVAPAYGLPGNPGIYSLAGNADTYVLHGQADSALHGQVDSIQHGQADSLDKWPAVDQLENNLTQEAAVTSSSTKRPAPVYHGSNTSNSQDWSNGYIKHQQKEQEEEQLKKKQNDQVQAGQGLTFASQDYQDIDYTSGNEVSYHISLS